MERPIWKHLLVLILVTVAAQSSHFFARWDETLWGMEGTFYGIGVKNFSRFDPSDHLGLLVQNGSPDVDETLRYYARTLMPFYWAEGLTVHLFGDREWVYRIVPALHGWLLPIFLYLLVCEFGCRRTALLAGIFAGASPMVGYYSTCTYSGPSACYIPGLLWAYLRWMKESNRYRTVVLVVLLFLCWMGNYFNLFFLPALIGLHWAVTRRGIWFCFWVGLSFLTVHLMQILHFLSVDPTLGSFFANVYEWTSTGGDRGSSGHSLEVGVNAAYTLVRLVTPMVLGFACIGGYVAFTRGKNNGVVSERGALFTLCIPALAIGLVFPGHTLVHEHDFYWFTAPIAWASAIGISRFSWDDREPRVFIAAASLFAFLGYLFVRGNRTCWYHPDHTILMLVVLSAAIIFFLITHLLRMAPIKIWAITVGLWTIASVTYTATLWGEETRVEEAIFVKGHSEISDRIASVTSVYPLDLYYAERSISPVSRPQVENGFSLDEWFHDLRSEGFDYLFLSSRADTDMGTISDRFQQTTGGDTSLIDLRTGN